MKRPKADLRLKATIRVWAAVLVLGFVGGGVFNVWLVDYARRARENDPQAHIESALSSIGRSNLPEALLQLDRALELAPESAMAHFLEGEVRFALKQWEDALVWYDKALALGCREPGARSNKLWTLIELKHYNEAVNFGIQSMEEGYKDAVFSRYTAEALIRDGRGIEAIPYLTATLESNPGDLYVLEQLRLAYVQAGNIEDAQRMKDRISEVYMVIQPPSAGRH